MLLWEDVEVVEVVVGREVVVEVEVSDVVVVAEVVVSAVVLVVVLVALSLNRFASTDGHHRDLVLRQHGPFFSRTRATIVSNPLPIEEAHSLEP